MMESLPQDLLDLRERLSRVEEKLDLLLEALIYKPSRAHTRLLETLLTPAEGQNDPVVHEGEVLSPGPKLSDIFRVEYEDLLK